MCKLQQLCNILALSLSKEITTIKEMHDYNTLLRTLIRKVYSACGLRICKPTAFSSLGGPECPYKKKKICKLKWSEQYITKCCTETALNSDFQFERLLSSSSSLAPFESQWQNVACVLKSFNWYLLQENWIGSLGIKYRKIHNTTRSIN